MNIKWFVYDKNENEIAIFENEEEVKEFLENAFEECDSDTNEFERFLDELVIIKGEQYNIYTNYNVGITLKESIEE